MSAPAAPCQASPHAQARIDRCAAFKNVPSDRVRLLQLAYKQQRYLAGYESRLLWGLETELEPIVGNLLEQFFEEVNR